MKFAVITLCGLLTVAVTPTLAQSVPADNIAQVNQVLDSLHDAADRADGPAYFSLFTSQARFIGTDAEERWSVEAFRAYAEPYFAQGRGWRYIPRERVISLLPLECQCVASFDERLDNAAYGETRGSGILIKTTAGWKIEQYVLSFAVPNDVARQVVAIIAAHEEPSVPDPSPGD